jgi:hypothetical protein
MSRRAQQDSDSADTPSDLDADSATGNKTDVETGATNPP